MIRVGGLLEKDPHVNCDGHYLIRSLYFDDIYDSCVWDTLAGAEPRSKFRIRYYESDTSYIMLEKKWKTRGMTLKEYCSIGIDECRDFMEGQIPILDETASAQKKKMFAEIQMRALKPKLIVSYERIPYVYSGGNVRITFDRNLSSSNQLERFLEGDYISRPVFPAGHSIMEVKWDEVMPRHIKEVMLIENLEWIAFSKYYMCRKYHL